LGGSGDETYDPETCLIGWVASVLFIEQARAKAFVVGALLRDKKKQIRAATPSHSSQAAFHILPLAKSVPVTTTAAQTELTGRRTLVMAA
jgi:hypothetical protein